jgi:membrane-associated HD superfamily phosphohydrolase
VIYDILRFMHRRRRYREVSALIISELTKRSQERLDRTLTEAYEKGLTQGVPQEELKSVTQKMIENVNEILAKENARRIHQWSMAILDAEE